MRGELAGDARHRDAAAKRRAERLVLEPLAECDRGLLGRLPALYSVCAEGLGGVGAVAGRMRPRSTFLSLDVGGGHVRRPRLGSDGGVRNQDGLLVLIPLMGPLLVNSAAANLTVVAPPAHVWLVADSEHAGCSLCHACCSLHVWGCSLRCVRLHARKVAGEGSSIMASDTARSRPGAPARAARAGA